MSSNYFSHEGRGSSYKKNGENRCTLENIDFTTTTQAHHPSYSVNDPCGHVNYYWYTNIWPEAIKGNSCNCNMNSIADDFSNIAYFKYNKDTSMCEPQHGDFYNLCYNNK